MKLATQIGMFALSIGLAMLGIALIRSRGRLAMAGGLLCIKAAGILLWHIAEVQP